jgi:hypothetical protein
VKNRASSSAPRAKVLACSLLVYLIVTAICLDAAQLKEARVTQVVNDVKLGSPQAAPRRVAIDESFRDGDAINTG